MLTTSTKVMRVVVFCLFLTAVLWATYASYELWQLSVAFPSHRSAAVGFSKLGAEITIYGVVFGPVLIASVLLAVSWLKKKPPSSS